MLNSLNDSDKYKSILKNTSLLGFVQIIMVLVSMLRSKINAELIGAEGMGLIYILTNITGLVGTISNFGLGTLATKNIAEVSTSNNFKKIAKMNKTFAILSVFTGLLGTILIILFSGFFSVYSFGNNNYTSTFIIISICLFMAQINTSRFVLLQGLRKFDLLAKSNLLAGVLILILTSAILYFIRNEGIIYVIILYSLVPLLVSQFFYKKIKLPVVNISKLRVSRYAIELFTIGTTISFSRILPLIVGFILNAYITNKTGLAEVGLFTAGFAIIFNYTGVVFTAMEPDYFSRLSSDFNNENKVNDTISKQIEIAFLLVLPIIILFIVFIKVLIGILYSSDFYSITNMMVWGMLGLVFKTLSWPLNYVLLIKNKSGLYFINELIYNLYYVFLSVLLYDFFGISGLGIAFLISNIIYMFQVNILISKQTSFKFINTILFNYKFYLLQSIIVLLSITISSLKINVILEYFLGLVLLIMSLYISFKKLNRIFNLNEIILNKISNFLKIGRK